ncbi:hypothetical protein EJ08DRAFT_64255 [Tothia fuscella]|uniref:Telomere-associated protein Rif1 N-terminal domain-containing protein n=1 Tax=Tothia fuscella TaxID=1048955 RepID=A0A9P4TSS2_9PEZI|nr:hypothetical protein EJ08DRAFT_64255 [Tothia fuscella]
MAFVSSLETFESYPARPPTPPRESTPTDFVDETLNDINDYLEDSNEIARLMSSTSKASVSTPEQTPPSSLPPTTTSLSRDKKRVDFVPFTAYEYYNTPDYSILRDKENVKALDEKDPPSSHRQNFITRSILKPSRPSDHSLAPAHNHRNLGAMLEEMLKSLAKDGKDQRIDAYVSMLATFKAYKSLPDADMKALKDKIKLLLHFVRRDMAAIDAETQKPDFHLITRSMKFLLCLFRLQDERRDLKDAFDSEDCASILEYSISVLQMPDLSKTIANHHLELIAQQRFGTRTLTADRVGRVLETLAALNTQLDGFKTQVVGRRVAIYQHLVDQVPIFMSAKASLWLEPLFSSMLSSIQEIRTPSTSVGVSVAIKLGGRKDTSRAMVELLTKTCDEKPFSEFLTDHLTKEIKDQELCVSVFRTWTAAILFLRGVRPSQLDKVSLQNLLSRVPQYAFNTGGDSTLKILAFRAWARLIYAENLSQSTPQSFRRVLKIPVMSHFQREKRGNFSKPISVAALSTYYALLYYALRPDTSFEQLDLYWDEYVSEVLSEASKRGRKHAEMGCQVLKALLASTAVWNENRANEYNKEKKDTEQAWDFDLKELPRLDPKWVRSRVAKILTLLGTLFEQFPEIYRVANSPTSSTSPSEFISDLNELWTALLSAVADAGTQEVTPSMELKSAIASITNFLARSAPRELKTIHLTRFMTSSLNVLGPTIHTDKILARDSSKGAFEAISTPSAHRSGKGGPVQSPVLHILGHLSARFTDVLSYDDPPSMDLVQHIVALSQQCLRSRVSRSAKVTFVVELIETFVARAQSQRPLDALFADPLQQATKAMGESSAGQIGQDYKLILRILSATLYHTASQLPALRQLYDQCVITVKKEAGDAGVLLAITEPHSQMLHDFLSSPESNLTIYLGYVDLILRNDIRPKNRRAIEQGRRQLWGGSLSSPVSAKTPDLEYEHLYPMLNKALWLVAELNCAAEVVFAVNSWLLRSSTAQMIIIRQIQEGIAVLVRDEVGKLKDNRGLFEQVQKLWKTVQIAIGGQKDTPYPEAFETLLQLPSQLPERAPDTLRVPPKMPRLISPMKPKLAAAPSPLRKATTPRSKLRHEDSQIQFEAIIESSPIVDQESQNLTERQKEVSERQHYDTAPLFRDISSPVRKQHALGNMSSDPLHSDTPDHRPSTPILAPALDDDILGSSPTAASVSRRESSISRRQSPMAVQYGPWKDEEEIPSSPPRGDDEEEHTGAGTEADEPTFARAISPLRLQSKAPEESSNDELVERAKLAFSTPAPEEVPEVEMVDRHDEEPSSSVERDMVNAQLVSEVQAAAIELPDISADNVIPDSQFVQQPQETSSLDVDASRVADSFSGVASSEVIVGENDNSTALDNDNNNTTLPLPLQNVDAPVPEVKIYSPSPSKIQQTQENSQSQLGSQIPQSPAQSQLSQSQSQLSQATSSLSQSQSQLESQSQSQFQSPSKMSRKRKGRPSLSQEDKTIKKLKIDADEHGDWKYKAGRGSYPVQIPTGPSRLLDDEDMEDIIYVQLTGEKRSSPAPAKALASIEESSPTLVEEEGPAPVAEEQEQSPAPMEDETPTPRANTRSQKALLYVQVTPGDRASRLSQRRSSAMTSTLTPTPTPTAIDTPIQHQQQRQHTKSDSNIPDSQPQVSTPQEIDAPQLAEGTGENGSESGGSAANGEQERRVLTPKSIMARLRGILTDCKSIVFGVQERREIDDILFEVKSEVMRGGGKEE